MRVCDNCVKPGEIDEVILAPAGRDLEPDEQTPTFDLCEGCKKALIERDWQALKLVQVKPRTTPVPKATGKPRGRPKKVKEDAPVAPAGGIVITGSSAGFTSNPATTFYRGIPENLAAEFEQERKLGEAPPVPTSI